MPVTVKYTDTFDKAADMAISHFAEYSNELEAIEKIEHIIGGFEDRVKDNPAIYSRSATLMDLGITTFREAKIGGMRLFYQISADGVDTVVLARLIISQKQSIEEQLVNFCIIYK